MRLYRKVAVLLFILTGLQGIEPVSAQEKTPIKFTLDWLIGGRHAGWFTALEKGYYDQEGLRVTISRGFGLDDGLRRVATGDADINFNDSAAAILFKVRDRVPLKVLAVLYQKHPGMIFTPKKLNITTPKDLEGKTLTESTGSATHQLFAPYATRAGFDASKVKWVIVPPDAKMQLMLAGKADGTVFYSMQLPIIEKTAIDMGGVNTLSYGDYLPMYSNGVIVNDSFVAKNPETLRRFLRASMKGWEYAFAHPDEAGRYVLKHQPLLDLAVTVAEIMIVQDLAMTPEVKKHGIGYIEDAKMRETRDLVLNLNGIKDSIPMEQVYSNEFLPGGAAR